MDWQLLVTLLVIGLALVYLARHLYLFFRGRGGACHCGRGACSYAARQEESREALKHTKGL